MKKFLLSVAFATGFGGAACGQTCVWPSEKTAFEVVGLQNSLMVAALSCQADDSYNKFMSKYQAALSQQRAVLDRYFVRAGGLAGRQQEDGFMTRLANEHSSESLSQGPAYCAGTTTEFREVLGLPDVETLTAFASGNGGPEVAAMAVCDGTPPVGLSGPATVIAAAPAKAPSDEMVADAGKAGPKISSSISHNKHRAIAKAPSKPVTGLVQV
jgi:hypothetical protein